MTVSSANGSAGPLSQNYIINGGFDIWQRGTTFSAVTSVIFTADRFRIAGYSGSGSTFSRQAFTPGELVANTFGDAQFYLRANSTNTQVYFDQRIEDVRTLAGQVATLSFWAKAASPLTLSSNLFQGFGSGGSSDNVFTSKNNSITTSWQRFTHTFTVPSVSGKTIGAGSFLSPYFVSATLNTNLDIWGVQLEAGSTATPFRRNANSLQGELAACQRYYQRFDCGSLFGPVSLVGTAISTTRMFTTLAMKSSMRAVSSIQSANIRITDGVGGFAISNIFALVDNLETIAINADTTGLTQYRPYYLQGNNSTAGFIALNGEL
jgi:hypothetical protein